MNHEHRTIAQNLDKLSRPLAHVWADREGKPTSYQRKVMLAEIKRKALRAKDMLK